MTVIRPPAVAGLFYPAQQATLRATVRDLLASAQGICTARPRALIVPHAGYNYSGAAAAAAYLSLSAWRQTVKRVVLLGPPHRVAVQGIATSSASAFATPLGSVTLDPSAPNLTTLNACVTTNDAAHALEHALEVQLPFLQCVLDEITILPLLVATPDVQQISTLLAPWWDADDTVIVVSTDLSHYLDYTSARERDSATDRAIMRLDHGVIGPAQACGCRPLNGLLHLAQQRAARVERLALCNSGDTAGTRDRVVGYGAYAVH